MKACPKCSYTRTAKDAAVPDWQCPKCGIAYAKFEAQQLANWETKRAAPPAAPAAAAARGSSAALNMVIWAVSVVAFFAFLGYSGIFKAMHEAQLEGGAAMGGPPGGPPTLCSD